MNFPNFPGWKCIYASEVDTVGSWLLSNEGEAALLELPPGLTVEAIRAELGSDKLKAICASHVHEDHCDKEVLSAVTAEWPRAKLLTNLPMRSAQLLYLGRELLWRLYAPKHSWADAITVFRGVAMTGDIELGQLASCNREVPTVTRAESMSWYAGFEQRRNYHVHTVFSAHLNDLRVGVRWADLFVSNR